MAGIKRDATLLGDNATVVVENAEQDNWAKETLGAVGKSMTRAGFSYLGSAALHIYATDSKFVGTRGEVTVISQVQLDGINEHVSQWASVEFLKRLAASYQGEKKSIDTQYQNQAGEKHE